MLMMRLSMKTGCKTPTSTPTRCRIIPNETNSTEDASFDGQIHVDFKTDVPGNLTNAITLVDTSALDGQLHDLDGTDIKFALEGGVLVGRPDGTGDPLITITITGVTPVSAATQPKPTRSICWARSSIPIRTAKTRFR